MHDNITKPKHYTTHPSGVECIQIAQELPFNLGNTIKYVWRAGLKTNDKLEDLKKALFYVNAEMARVQRYEQCITYYFDTQKLKQIIAYDGGLLGDIFTAVLENQQSWAFADQFVLIAIKQLISTEIFNCFGCDQKNVKKNKAGGEND